MFCVGKLVTDWYALRKVLKQFTVQSLEFSGPFAVKRIETIAVTVQSEKATVEELVQMMHTLQGQQRALNQDISRLTGLAEIATRVGQAVQTTISNANSRSHERQSLVDIKGLGKPPMFKGESSKFTEWLRKTTGFLIAAFGSAFRPVIDWVENQDNVITNEALDRQFGPIGAEPVEDIQEKSEQFHVALLVHVALLALTESESFDIFLDGHHQVWER